MKAHSKKDLKIKAAVIARQCESYRWNYMRLDDSLRLSFLERMKNDFASLGVLDKIDYTYFDDANLTFLREVMTDPRSYYISHRPHNDNQVQESIGNSLFEQTLSNISARPINEQPDVSVIIPIYNSEPYLVDSLSSIANQTLQNIEIICINDGSTDASPAILEQFAAVDKRIRIITQDNQGQSSARNTGIRLARSPYLYFMDSDDTLEQNALEYLYIEAVQSNLDILFFDGDSLFDYPELKKQFSSYKEYYHRTKCYDSVQSGIDLFIDFHKSNDYRVSPCLQFIRRDYLLEQHIFFPEGYIYEDNVFTLKCILQAKKASHRSRRLFIRHIHSNSTTTSTVSFSHFYGYFRCFIDLTNYLTDKMFGDEAYSYIQHELNMMLGKAAESYIALPEHERKRVEGLPIGQRSLFETLVLPYICSYSRFGVSDWKRQALWAESELNAVKSSASYKLGRILTYMPRLLRHVRHARRVR